jgi:hypothetical protein
VAVLGYRGTTVESAIPERSLDQLPIPITEIADIAKIEERTQEVEDGTGGLVSRTVKIKTWVDPVAEDNTPMCQALDKCYDIVSQWASSHPSSFPPLVMNITDGEATDGNPEPHAEKIKSLNTSDGNVLFFNIHISPSGSTSPLTYPPDEEILPDDFAKRLFRMSSPLPESFLKRFNEDGYEVPNNSRGFVYNADVTQLIHAFDTGTRAAFYVEAGG